MNGVKSGRNIIGQITALCLCLLTALLAAACTTTSDILGKYPAPPPTEALATLLARGIATARPGYPAPIPGPLLGFTMAAPLNTPPATRTPTLIPVTPTSPDIPEAVQAASFYLAGHLGVTQGQVELASWEEALWPNSGLGCLPNEALTVRSPVEGYRITFSALGTLYEVHSDASGVNICVAEALLAGERVPLLQPKMDPDPAELARSHLAGRLGLSVTEVQVLEMEPGEWEDEYLGCARTPGNQPDRASPRSIQGQRILLEAREVTHEYHSGGFWLVYCGVVE